MLSKFIAVGSGKGGVGKSTTTINIALSLATTGKRVAIVDLDPLSNITTILDMPSATQGLNMDDKIDANVQLAEITDAYTENCDILFPHSKSISDSIAKIVHILFHTLRSALLEKYDVIFIDMPAGIANEFFVDLIPHIQHLIVVVIPEPTAHISAAGFAKATLQINPTISVYFWHNKFQTECISHFNSYAVIENYHNYVDTPHHFTAKELKRCRDVAYIPQEQMLDLLSTSWHPHECVWFKIKSVISFFSELYIRSFVRLDTERRVLQEYVVHYVLEHRVGNNVRQYVDVLIDDFVILQKSGVVKSKMRINDTLRRLLYEDLAQLSNYPLYRKMTEGIDRITYALAEDRLNKAHNSNRYIQLLEQHIIALLRIFDMHEEGRTKSMARCAMLLSVYISFSKILRHQKMRTFVLQHIPTRKERGIVVRDRRRQIVHLISKNTRLHDAHIQLVRRIYPIIIKQMLAINTRYSLSTSNFMIVQKKLHVRAYLQLISHIMHEIIHCGLGVVIGISTSRTWINTKKGSERILSLVS